MQNEGRDAFRAHESVNLYEPLSAGRPSEFLGGIDKGPFLKVLLPHIFFDDQTKNLIEAAEEIPTVHIPFRIANAADSSQPTCLPTLTLRDQRLRGEQLKSRNA